MAKKSKPKSKLSDSPFFEGRKTPKQGQMNHFEDDYDQASEKRASDRKSAKPIGNAYGKASGKPKPYDKTNSSYNKKSKAKGESYTNVVIDGDWDDEDESDYDNLAHGKGAHYKEKAYKKYGSEFSDRSKGGSNQGPGARNRANGNPSNGNAAYGNKPNAGKAGANKAGANKTYSRKAGTARTGSDKSNLSKPHAGKGDSMNESRGSYNRSEQIKGANQGANQNSDQRSNYNSNNYSGKPSPNYRGKTNYRGKGNTRNGYQQAEDRVVREIFHKFHTENTCGVYGSCGGCQLQHLTYEGQLRYKDHKINQLLGAYGKVQPIVGMDNPLHYRNKVHATFSYDKKGKIISGIYEEESHHVIPVTNCEIQNSVANKIINTIRELMPSFKMMPYDEDFGTGFLRHVLIRRGHVSGEVLVVLVAGRPVMPSKNNFVKALLERHPEITSVVLNINSRRTSMVLGNQETVLYGKGTIEDTLCGTVFRLSPKSFYQVNSVQTEKLYNKAIELAGLTGTETVLDAYCGIGTIGLIASKKAKEVIGVELNKDAVKDAIYNAKYNHIDNARFYQADAGDFMVALAEEKEKIDVVFMDPPRSGSDEPFLASLVKLAPKTVVYVSCGPESLARDLKYLTANGYKVQSMHAFDMFPMTEHVECVILMQRSGLKDEK